MAKRKRSASRSGAQDAEQATRLPHDPEYDLSEDDATTVPTRATRAAARKPITYVEIGSDVDDEDEESELASQSQHSSLKAKRNANDRVEDIHEAAKSDYFNLPKREAAISALTALSKDPPPKARKSLASKSKGTSGLSKLAAHRTTDDNLLAGELSDTVLNSDYVRREITRLRKIVPNWKQLYLPEASGKFQVQQIPDLDTTLIEQYLPKDGNFSKGSLIQWLRSGSTLPIIKRWFDKWTGSKINIKLMKSFLPLKDYPWPSQLKRVTELAGLPNSGGSNEMSEAEVVLCARFTRKLFLCNHMVLLENGTGSDKFKWHRILDIPCAVLFAVYYELVTTPSGEDSFFGLLLKSELATPMHSNTREILEKRYTLPKVYNKKADNGRFFTAAVGSKPGSSMPHLPPSDAIDHHAHYMNEPLSDKEQLAFWLGYQDPTEWSHLFGIDYRHIGELLPGRCEQELADFYALHKATLGVEPERRIIVARSGEKVQDVVGSSKVVAAASQDVEEAGGEIVDGEKSDAVAEGERELDSQEGPIAKKAKRHPRPTEADALALLSLQSLNNGPSSSREPAEKARGFGGLHLYVPPPPTPLHPPLPRKLVRPEIRAQIDAVNEAQRLCNEVELDLAWLQSNLQDVQSDSPAGQIDSLAVQMARYERDEAAALLEERQYVLGKARWELLVVRKRYGGDEVEEVIDLTGGSPEDEDAGESG